MYLSASSNYSHIVHRFLNPIKHSRSFIKQYINTNINIEGTRLSSEISYTRTDLTA